MEPWELAVNEFLTEWMNKDEIIGALVCGSYVTGNPSKRSDIDIHIVLASHVNWRERGNEMVNGFLIEYFVNPPSQIQKYFEEDYMSKRTMSMVQFITGKTLFEHDGVIAKLKAEANDWIQKDYAGLNERSIELRKYAIWDACDNLKDCYEQKRGDFSFVYFNALSNLFYEYGDFLAQERIPYYQLYTYLTDPKFLKKYVKDEFSDSTFSKMFVKAIDEANAKRQMDLFENLSEHVLQEMGGFEINGWKLRSSTVGK